jgi:hypothetical protein
MARALLEEATLRAGLERLMREAVESYTQPGLPPGCLIVSAATNCSSPEVEESLRSLRTAELEALEHLIARGTARGELPPETDARALAVFTSVTLRGMAQQARDGAGRDELTTVAAIAMSAWPWLGAPRRQHKSLEASTARSKRKPPPVAG